MSDAAPIRFAGRELAERIAAIHGSTTQTIKVRMVGKEDVSKLLHKARTARQTPPSSTFRIK